MPWLVLKLTGDPFAMGSVIAVAAVPRAVFMLLGGALTDRFSPRVVMLRGPFSVGVPAFADAFLTEGAAGFGTILSALGVGAIIGTVIAGSTRLPPSNRIGILLLLDFVGFGVVLATMMWVRELWIIATMVLVGGILDGYIIVFIITWVQKRIPTHLMGRVMSVVMFFSQGMFPISSALAGVAAGIDLGVMLLVSGSLMIFVAVVGLLFRPLRRLGYD